MSVHELYFGRKLDVKHLRIFDNIAYMHVSDENQKKLDAKAKNYILVLYSHEEKGYKSYNIWTKQVCVSRDVVFDESTSWYCF